MITFIRAALVVGQYSRADAPAEPALAEERDDTKARPSVKGRQGSQARLGCKSDQLL